MNINLQKKDYLKAINIFISLSFIVMSILVSWGLFAFQRGYHAEQSFYIRSLLTSGYISFFYPDVSRPFMSTLYHLGFLVTGGTFYGLHLMYGLTILATAILSTMVARKLNVNSVPLLILLFAIVLIVGAEVSMNVPSMIIVRQAVVASLFSFYISLIILKDSTMYKYKVFFLIITVLISQIFALWSYEASLGMLIGFLIFIFINFKKSPNFLYIIIINISILIYFLFYTFMRYIVGNENSYQKSKFYWPSTADILERYEVYLVKIINPLSWNSYWKNFYKNCEESFEAFSRPWALLMVLGSIILLYYFYRSINNSNYKPTEKLNYAVSLCILLLFTYLPFIFVTDGGGSWRTHFYAIPIFSISVIWILFNVSQNRALRHEFYSFLIFSYIIMLVYFGVLTSLASQLEMNYRWQENKTFSNSLLLRYDNIREHTLVIVYNYPLNFSASVCKNDINYDNFGQDFWMTSALRTIYPYSDVRGVYFDDRGLSKTEHEIIFEDGFIGFSDSVKRYGLQDIVFFKWDSGNFLYQSTTSEIPSFLKNDIYYGNYQPQDLFSRATNYHQVNFNFTIPVGYLP